MDSKLDWLKIKNIDPDLLMNASRPKPKRSSRIKAAKAFKAEWVKFPSAWREALRRAKCVATYDLAITILFEAFKRERINGEIVLSAEITKLPRNTRRRATRELVKLDLIKLHRGGGNQAYRVSAIHIRNKKGDCGSSVGP
jgi:hypothetical protein